MRWRGKAPACMLLHYYIYITNPRSAERMFPLVPCMFKGNVLHGDVYLDAVTVAHTHLNLKACCTQRFTFSSAVKFKTVPAVPCHTAAIKWRGRRLTNTSSETREISQTFVSNYKYLAI